MPSDPKFAEIQKWVDGGGTVMAWIFNTTCFHANSSGFRNSCSNCVELALDYSFHFGLEEFEKEARNGLN